MIPIIKTYKIQTIVDKIKKCPTNRNCKIYLITGVSGSGGGICTYICLWTRGFESAVVGGPYSIWIPLLGES